MILWDSADDSITLKEIGTASSSEGSSSPLLSKSNQIVDEMSKVAAYGAENEGEFLEEASSLLISIQIFTWKKHRE